MSRPSTLRPARVASTLVVAALLVACGAADKQSPARGPDGIKAPEPPREVPPPAPPSGTSSTESGGVEVSATKSAGEMERAQRELDEAGSDCKAACRALGGMDRAAGHLCKMTQTSDDRTRCDEAKGKVYKARDRVRAACGACPGGPSVDRAAPIPSQ